MKDHRVRSVPWRSQSCLGFHPAATATTEATEEAAAETIAITVNESRGSVVVPAPR
jgi:hypothetical protein